MEVFLSVLSVFVLVSLSSGTPIQNISATGDKTLVKDDTRGLAVGSDNGLYNQDMFEGDILLPPKSKNAITDSTKKWPYGNIVYTVHKNVGCPGSMQCSILMQAMDHYHHNSCIRFKERSDEVNYVEIFYNDDSGACWSPVGMHGGVQRLSLGYRCWYLGIVVHELGHTIGFWHEMNRPDRDQFIEIYWKNIISGYSSAFTKQDASTVDTLGEPFDYTSVMMYDELAFSKDGVSETIQPRQAGVTIGPIWKKTGLSISDVRRLHKLYKCTSNDALSGFPLNVKCSFNQNSCGYSNRNSDSTNWSWRSVNRTDGYMYSTVEKNGNHPAFLTSVSHHGLEQSDKRGPLGCVRFWHFIQSDKSAYLKLSQTYLKKVTQSNPDPRLTYELWMNDNVTNWVHVQVPLYVTRPFKLIFESKFDDKQSSGTIAIDDVEVLYTPCSVTTTTTTKPLSTTTTPYNPTTTPSDEQTSYYDEITTPTDVTTTTADYMTTPTIQQTTPLNNQGDSMEVFNQMNTEKSVTTANDFTLGGINWLTLPTTTTW